MRKVLTRRLRYQPRSALSRSMARCSAGSCSRCPTRRWPSGGYSGMSAASRVSQPSRCRRRDGPDRPAKRDPATDRHTGLPKRSYRRPAHASWRSARRRTPKRPHSRSVALSSLPVTRAARLCASTGPTSAQGIALGERPHAHRGPSSGRSQPRCRGHRDCRRATPRRNDQSTIRQPAISSSRISCPKA